MSKVVSKKIMIVLTLGFMGLILVPWADEIFDFPHLIVEAPSTPFNWQEASIETLVILLVGLPVISIIRRSLSQMEEIRRKLAKSNEQLAVINHQKSKLLGMAAHDLRAPLATIQMALKIINAAGSDPEKEKKYIGIIDSQANNMKILIDDFLDATKLEIGKISIEKELLDYKVFLEEIIKINEVTAARRGITFGVNIDNIPLLYFDPDRMRQVLNNLLGNALKFSYKDSSIDVSVKNSGRFVRTMITDRGPGIPEDFKKKMFKEFQIGSIKPATDEPQIGLGLVICKKIVNLHHGRIWFASEEGKGATFHFTLPV